MTRPPIVSSSPFSSSPAVSAATSTHQTQARSRARHGDAAHVTISPASTSRRSTTARRSTRASARARPRRACFMCRKMATPTRGRPADRPAELLHAVLPGRRRQGVRAATRWAWSQHGLQRLHQQHLPAAEHRAARRRSTPTSATSAWRRRTPAPRTCNGAARKDPGGQVGLQPQLVVARGRRDVPLVRDGGDRAVHADHLAVPASRRARPALPRALPALDTKPPEA